MNPFKKRHDCGDSRLTCFDCNKRICARCQVVTPVAQRCNECSRGTVWNPATVSASNQALLRLELASVFLSMVAAKLWTILTPCIS